MVLTDTEGDRHKERVGWRGKWRWRGRYIELGGERLIVQYDLQNMITVDQRKPPGRETR